MRIGLSMKAISGCIYIEGQRAMKLYSTRNELLRNDFEKV